MLPKAFLSSATSILKNLFVCLFNSHSIALMYLSHRIYNTIVNACHELSWSPGIACISLQCVPRHSHLTLRGTDTAVVGVLLSPSQMLFELLKDRDCISFTTLLVSSTGTARRCYGFSSNRHSRVSYNQVSHNLFCCGEGFLWSVKNATSVKYSRVKHQKMRYARIE